MTQAPTTITIETNAITFGFDQPQSVDNARLMLVCAYAAIDADADLRVDQPAENQIRIAGGDAAQLVAVVESFYDRAYSRWSGSRIARATLRATHAMVRA